jgi:3-oxoacyl-[acyl-carrier-protein] synthase III
VGVMAGISAPNYIVGEHPIDVDQLPNKQSRLAEFGMPDIRELWGWGECRKSDKSSVQLAIEVARKVLKQKGMTAAAIEAVVLCCSDAGNYYAQNRFMGALTTGLGLNKVFVSWVSGAGCASLFSAVKIASAFVVAEMFNNVLVLTVDRIDNDEDRLQRFGVLSDGACGLLVQNADNSDFAVKGIAVLSCPVSLEQGGKDFQSKCNLIQTVFDSLQRSCDFDFSLAVNLFSSNLFVPVQELETSALPIDGLVTHQANVVRYGHCYAADPVINLVDFYADTANAQVLHSMMASSAHGHFGMILLERRHDVSRQFGENAFLK